MPASFRIKNFEGEKKYTYFQNQVKFYILGKTL